MNGCILTCEHDGCNSARTVGCSGGGGWIAGAGLTFLFILNILSSKIFARPAADNLKDIIFITGQKSDTLDLLEYLGLEDFLGFSLT